MAFQYGLSSELENVVNNDESRLFHKIKASLLIVLNIRLYNITKNRSHSLQEPTAVWIDTDPISMSRDLLTSSYRD